MNRFPVHHLMPEVIDKTEIWQVARPPQELWIEGSEESLKLLDQIPRQALAIVGSRDCQMRSRALVRRTIAELQGSGLIIVSGLALGIDSEAHRSALTFGLKTIAVLGCGIGRSYPPQNDELRREILEAGGAVISEFAPDEPPRGPNFIHRNRLIAGWSAATWVVEAGHHSGAINTASWAKKMERPCFVTPCYPEDSSLAGNQRLLESERLAEGIVLPFWRTRSLSFVWLELESHLSRRTKTSRRSNPMQRSSATPLEQIQREIERRSLQQGGVRWNDLMSWSDSKGYQPSLFFAALHSAQASGRVVLNRGVLMGARTESLAE